MLRRLVHVGFWVVLVVVLTSGIQNDDGRAGKTGSPGEQTCVNTCHDSFALNSGPGSISVSSPNMTNWEYVPGMTYTFNVEVAEAGSNLFGVGIEMLEDAGNTSSGQLVITQPAETEIKSALIQGQARTNVVHRLNGGLGSGSKTFTFDWTAPVNPAGDLTIYFAGVAANGNGNNNGDRVYTGSQDIVLGNVGVNEQGISALEIYPNPASYELNLSIPGLNDQVLIELYDMNGRLVLQEDRKFSHFAVLSELGAIQSGNYLLRISSDGMLKQERIVLHK